MVCLKEYANSIKELRKCFLGKVARLSLCLKLDPNPSGSLSPLDELYNKVLLPSVEIRDPLFGLVEDQLFELVELGHYLQKYLRKSILQRWFKVDAVWWRQNFPSIPKYVFKDIFRRSKEDNTVEIISNSVGWLWWVAVVGGCWWWLWLVAMVWQMWHVVVGRMLAAVGGDVEEGIQREDVVLYVDGCFSWTVKQLKGHSSGTSHVSKSSPGTSSRPSHSPTIRHKNLANDRVLN
ncbi:hypothetical protein Tco_0290557 [Tanacetum coccineum]